MNIANTFFFSLLLIISACSRAPTLNIQEHAFNVKPKRIIWLQIPGLDEEHIALLRFWHASAFDRTSFENSTCFGKVWNFNLYDVRPDAYAGALSQLTGKSDITSTCKDFENKFIWEYLNGKNNQFASGILLAGINDNKSNDLEERITGCKTKNLNETITWKMAAAPPASPESPILTFHFEKLQEFQSGKTYYDRSCDKKICYSSISKNVENIFREFEKNKTYYFFLIQDYSYFNAYQSKQIDLMKDSLMELEKIYAYFSDLAARDSDVLVILTGTAAQRFEFPKSGRDWAAFEMKGTPVFYHQTALMSPVFVKGARAENFCGIYRSPEIFQRLMFESGKVK